MALLVLLALISHTTTTDWNGHNHTTTRTFAVLHTADNNIPCTDGNAQRIEEYFHNLEDEHGGYHIIIDEDNTLVSQDPATRRAYGAIGGNDGIQLGFACNADHWCTHYQRLHSNPLYKSLLRAKNALDYYGIERTRLEVDADWPVHPPTNTRPGYILVPADAVGVIGHSDIQSNKNDPGRCFPWEDLLE